MRGALRRLALLLLLSGCSPQLIDGCEDRRVGDASCVNLVLSGDLGDLSLLGVTASAGNAFSGYSEAGSDAPFQLPATLGVALPRTLAVPVRLEVRALLGRRPVGQGTVVVPGLAPGEHRDVDLTLDPAPATP